MQLFHSAQQPPGGRPAHADAFQVLRQHGVEVTESKMVVVMVVVFGGFGLKILWGLLWGVVVLRACRFEGCLVRIFGVYG